MKRTALILILAAACGGKKPAPAKPETTSAEQASTTEAAKPAEPATPAEPAKPAEPKVDETAVAQAALTEQYEAGKKVYKEKGCANCHGDTGGGSKTSPPVIGEKALPEAAPKTAKLRKGVSFKTGADVLGFVKAKMPIKKPGTLSDDEAAAVTAWMLSENKANLEKKLDATNAAMVNVHGS